MGGTSCLAPRGGVGRTRRPPTLMTADRGGGQAAGSYGALRKWPAPALTAPGEGRRA
jgi:hypothetical protein